ncbi:cation diffusion facilitator family transporter, partial [Candidatus Bathyarchaeota archaeon]|nr:cation diffusion facilitator family transporter [Candidatus Bathyarchaeota archaeon]
IIYSALGSIFEPTNLFELNLAIAISILATTLNGGLSWFLSRAARESGSAAFEVDSMHLMSDVISSIGVWIGLFVVQLTGWSPMDSILAIAIAVLISRIGIGLILKSSYGLMDQSCKEEEEKIKKVFFLHKSSFTNFHDVKTRRHGNQILAELHLSIDGSLSVEEAHELADHLEEELKDELPNITLTIHIEPTK